MYGSPIIMASAQGRMDSAAIEAAVNAFHGSIGANQRSRKDSLGVHMRRYRERLNARRFDAAFREHSLDGRADGFSQNAGFHLARDLEFIHQEVLTEKFPLHNSFRLFSESDTVPVGANTHTMRRVFDQGEAKIFRGAGDKTPRATVTQREETFQVRHVVSSYAWDIFEQASDQFAGGGAIRQKARVARDAIMNLINRINWQGSEADGLYGVINYPFLDKRVMPIGFSRATVRADPDGVLSSLHELANFPAEESNSTFSPDVLVLTERIHHVLTQVRFGAGSDTTILAHFLETSPHIKRVEVAWELRDAFGAGIDGLFAYRNDQMGVQHVMPQGVTQLPVQMKGFESEVHGYASIGGIIMPDVGNNVMGIGDVNA